MVRNKKKGRDNKKEKRLKPEDFNEIRRNRAIKNILFTDDLRGKKLIYSEDVIFKDGSVDFIFYYIKMEDDLQNPDTVIFADRYSEQRKRKLAKMEFERKRRKAE